MFNGAVHLKVSVISANKHVLIKYVGLYYVLFQTFVLLYETLSMHMSQRPCLCTRHIRNSLRTCLCIQHKDYKYIASTVYK